MALQDTSTAGPVLGKVRSSKSFIYVVINLAVFTDAYLYGLIIPVLPFALVERVNVRESDVQEWIGILLAAYGAGLIIGSPTAGWIADGGDSRRGPYLWGLIALAVSTLAFSIGRATWILFLGRLVQGASSAIVHTVGMAILADTVGQAGIGPAMGFVTMSIALGVVFGPMVGGILYHQMGYLAVFVSAYALVALDFLLRVMMLASKDKALEENNTGPEHTTYGTLTYNGSKPPDSPRCTTPDTTSSLVSRTSSFPSTTSSIPTTHISPPYRHPLATLLTTPRMLTAILGDFANSLILTALETVLPLRIKTLFSYNSQHVALIFLFLSLPSFAAPLIGHLSDRIGAKTCVCIGFVATAPLLILLRLVDHYERSQVILLCILLLAIGLSLNFILTPVFSEAMYVVDDAIAADPGVFGDKSAYAQAFGLMNVAYAAGSLAGPLMGGLLVERVGWDGLTLAMGVGCLLCMGPGFWVTGGRRVGVVKLREGEEEERGDI